jgi:hypothetical protein
MFMLSGCAIVEGDAVYLVTAVGRSSEWGKILAELDVERPDTPLQVGPRPCPSRTGPGPNPRPCRTGPGPGLRLPPRAPRGPRGRPGRRRDGRPARWLRSDRGQSAEVETVEARVTVSATRCPRQRESLEGLHVRPCRHGPLCWALWAKAPPEPPKWRLQSRYSGAFRAARRAATARSVPSESVARAATMTALSPEARPGG